MGGVLSFSSATPYSRHPHDEVGTKVKVEVEVKVKSKTKTKTKTRTKMAMEERMEDGEDGDGPKNDVLITLVTLPILYSLPVPMICTEYSER